jgi:hypothetical protein
MLRHAINCTALMLALTVPAAGKARHAHHAHAHRAVGRVAGAVAIGDSLALGFGLASGFEIAAAVSEPSCPSRLWRGIVAMVPARHFRFALISAGTNDVPGRCVEAIREKVSADEVMWVIPVNGARQHVLSVAQAHQDRTLFYTPGRNWPHPTAYFDVLRGH